VNKDITNIFESYQTISEIAFPHQEYDEPNQQDDKLLGVLQQLQNSSGPLHGVSDDVIQDLVTEYSDLSDNAELEMLNHGLIDADLFLLEFNRSGQTIYIMLNLNDESIYPDIFTNFEEAATYAIETANKLSEGDDFEDNDLPQNPSRM